MLIEFKEVKKPFDKLSYGEDRPKVFSWFLDYALNYFNLLDKDQMGKFEMIYKNFHYNTEQVPELLKNLLVAFSNASMGESDQGLSDALGQFYMLECMGKGKLGQIFTPMEIAILIASIMMHDDIAEGKPILDPTCGSGTLLLAAARFNRNNIFYGADLDHTVCKMAALNLLWNGLDGEIAWMNSLSNDFYGCWLIGKTHVTIEGKSFKVPAFEYTVDSNKSRIHLKTKEEREALKKAG